jgi:hypothetical protein
MPLDAAHDVLDQLASISPVLRQHWQVMTDNQLYVDAGNYPLFLISSFAACCIPIAKAVQIYRPKWRIMLPPHPAGLFLIILIFSLYYALEVAGGNSASLTFRSIFQLYLDRVGIYYVGQFAIIWVYSIGLLFLTLAVLHSISALARYLNPIERNPEGML